MGIKYYLVHPCIASRKLIYYLVGNSIGRLFYPSNLFKSRWFSKITESGWKWVCHGIINQKIRGINRNIPWPVSPYQNLLNPNNIHFHIDDLNNFQMIGSYFQSFGNIIIGRGTYIAQNVGFITANHDYNNLDNHLPSKDIVIGEKCWIGMNSVILPGVRLGNRTVVGAGSIVTKSFKEGHCIIAGNPAKIIRLLSNNEG